MTITRIRCNAVNYRKGFVEIVPLIHEGCINLEAWGIHPDVDISMLEIADEQLSDEAVTSNIELELSIDAAEQLVEALQAGLREVRARL